MRRFDPGGRDHPDEAAALAARIAIVGVVVVGQLWALTAALDAWLGGDSAAVWWLLGYQALSFGVCLIVWIAAPRGD